MGRTEKSQGLAPPAIRKDLRAKQARHIVNKVVPAILASNARARKGAEGSELIVDPVSTLKQKDGDVKEAKDNDGGNGNDAKYIKRKGQGRRKAKHTIPDDEEPTPPPKSKSKNQDRRESPEQDMLNGSTQESTPSPPPTTIIRILATDTLTAARTLLPATKAKNQPNPCILNMASPLRPGGGLLTGATSQEEFLCARTTLLPSLKESFYRLPERGAIFTRDVLVFRNALPLGDAAGELGAAERWYVDVVSAGMLRFPDLEGEEDEDEEKRLSQRDRALVEEKMRAVLRIVSEKGARRVVLGAWGCGAYGNPVRDVAEAWRSVLLPASVDNLAKKGRRKEQGVETWEGLREVVFAVGNVKMAREFAEAFGEGVEVEEGPDRGGDEEEDDGTDEVAEELRAKITEMEGQIEKVWNADLKQRMSIILDELKAQLQEREGEQGKEREFSAINSENEEETHTDEESGTEEFSEEEEMYDSGGDGRDGNFKLP